MPQSFLVCLCLSLTK